MCNPKGDALNMRILYFIPRSGRELLSQHVCVRALTGRSEEACDGFWEALQCTAGIMTRRYLKPILLIETSIAL